MVRSFRSLALVPVALAVALTLLSSVPVAAWTNEHQKGSVGDWTFGESSDAPLVTCKYGALVNPDDSFMKWLKVQPPTVFAADRNSAKVDKARVTWQIQLQHSTSESGPWINGAKSVLQTATAYDNKAAPFTALTIIHNGHNDPNDYIRIKVSIKWYQPVDTWYGTITFNPSYYYRATPFPSGLSGGPYCLGDQTEG